MTMHSNGEQQLKSKLLNILAEYDVFCDIPNFIIASSKAEEFVNKIIEASHSHLIEKVEKLKYTQAELDKADEGFLLPTLYLERKGHNQALDQVISLLKRKGEKK